LHQLNISPFRYEIFQSIFIVESGVKYHKPN